MERLKKGVYVRSITVLKMEGLQPSAEEEDEEVGLYGINLWLISWFIGCLIVTLGILLSYQELEIEHVEGFDELRRGRGHGLWWGFVKDESLMDDDHGKHSSDHSETYVATNLGLPRIFSLHSLDWLSSYCNNNRILETLFINLVWWTTFYYSLRVAVFDIETKNVTCDIS